MQNKMKLKQILNVMINKQLRQRRKAKIKVLIPGRNN